MTEVDRQEIAKRFGLPEQLADRLDGSTAAEVEADARALADAIGVAPQAEHVELARRALEAAENNPNRAELAAVAALDNKAEWGQRLVEVLHRPSEDGGDE